MCPDADEGSLRMRAYIQEHGIAIPPRELKVLQAAFDRAWDHLANSQVRRADDAVRLRNSLAREIIDFRERGERDPKRLATLAILSITAGYRDQQ
jgi:hypothetical protein